MMTPRRLSLPLLLAIAAAAVIIAACGGGGDDDADGPRPGALTDPENVPTSSPWEQPPGILMIDPDNITPISGGATPVPEPGDSDGDDGDSGSGECGSTYEIESGDSFSLVAEKCGVDLQDLLDANPDVDPATLSIGQKIKIP